VGQEEGGGIRLQLGDERMTIHCEDFKQFMDVIAGCVERGLGFHANATDFSVTLTGAH